MGRILTLIVAALVFFSLEAGPIAHATEPLVTVQAMNVSGEDHSPAKNQDEKAPLHQHMGSHVHDVPLAPDTFALTSVARRTLGVTPFEDHGLPRNKVGPTLRPPII